MKLPSVVVLSVVSLLMVAGCGGEGDPSPDVQLSAEVPSAEPQDAASPNAENVDVESAGDTTADAPVAAPSDGGGGTLTLDGEVIEFAHALCYLQEQDSAAGGGKILYTAQAKGVNSAGEPIMIDVSRYDEDSMFAGDSIEVVVGDYMKDDYESFTLLGDGEDYVTVEGSTVSAAGVELMSEVMGSPVTVSFEITC